MPREFEDKTEILGGGDPRRQPRLGRYRLERRIGAGGMAEIFLARAEGPGGFEKQVVIKRIRPQLVGNDRFVEMFLLEARLLATLDHPNIVRIFELDQQDGEYFLALEYLEGLSLREVVERFWLQKRPVPIEPIIRVLADAALGLEHAHNCRDMHGNLARLVHRDVSPDNIFLTTAGVTKVLDFGIAKNENEALTQQGELKGKIPYMSPEQLKGDVLDGRTDLFSLGITTYWLCAGRRPFDGVTDVHTMKAILEDPPKPLRVVNPRIPGSLEAVVMSCLEKDRDRRIKSAGALHDALMMLLVGLPRGWPAPDIIVEQAMKMTAVEHELAPQGPPAVNVVPWPDRGAAVPMLDDGATATTRSHRKAAVPLPPAPRTDDSIPRRSRDGEPPPTHKIPVWAPRQAQTDDFDHATEQFSPSSVDVSTDEHDRVPPSDPSVSSARSGSGEGSFLVNSDPMIGVDRSADAPTRLTVDDLDAPVDPGAPTRQKIPQAAIFSEMAVAPTRLQPSASGPAPIASPPPSVTTAESGSGATTPAHVREQRARQNDRGLHAKPFSPVMPLDSSGSTSEQLPAPGTFAPAVAARRTPSRVLPIVGGIFAALVVVTVALWASGGLARIWQRYGDRMPFKIPPQLAFLELERTDAGVPDVLDAGATAIADAGVASIVVDAGAAPWIASDGGTKLVDPPKGTRALQLVAPPTVQWIGPAGEVLANGEAQVKLAPGTKFIYALDLARSVKTKVAIVDRATKIDYARLPKGKLAIRVRPYADVYLGAERIGRTPMPVLNVVAGTYEVRLAYKKKKKDITVEVKPGKAQALVQHEFK